MKVPRSKPPSPGKRRWCRLHESTSIERSGASASWTKKILSAGMVSIASGIVPLREDVEAVETQADARMVGEAHDASGRLVAVDESAPGERLVGDANTEALGDVPELAQLGGSELLVPAARRRDVAAQQHGLDAEAIHERELRRCATEVLLEEFGADALEIAERLVQVERQPELLGARADRLRRLGRGDQIRLEDLNSIEPRLVCGDELLIECAAQADRGDRRAHGAFLRPPALVSA